MTKPYKLNNKYREQFRKWIKDNYSTDLTGLKYKSTNVKLYAIFVVNGVVNKVRTDRPYGKQVDLFWKYMVEEKGFNPNKIPRWHKPIASEFVATLGKADYDRYIKSSEWLQKSKALIKSRGSECEVCASTTSLHSHHYNYRFLGKERSKDLFCLCEKCHDLYHYMIPSSKLPKDKDDGVGDRLMHIINTIQSSKMKIKSIS